MELFIKSDLKTVFFDYLKQLNLFEEKDYYHYEIIDGTIIVSTSAIKNKLKNNCKKINNSELIKIINEL